MKITAKSARVILFSVAVLSVLACNIESDYVDKIAEYNIEGPGGPSYTITYDGNGNTGGNPPVDGNSYKEGDEVTLLSTATMTKTGYSHAGWNTKADGSGTSFTIGETVNMPANNILLYAQWTLIPTYRVHYKGNGSDDDTQTPEDTNTYYAGDWVTVLGQGDLLLEGKTFVGWNTESNGSGTN